MKIVRCLLILCLPVLTLAQDTTKGLKDYYANYFSVGVAVGPFNLRGPDSFLIVKHFNSLTAENAMKMQPIHPQENRYNWEPADAIVNFAVKHGMKMRGHTLCWHKQAPGWMFRDSTTGGQASKELLLKRLKEHITTVVNRYKGKIYAWDVVNEVIEDNDSLFYHNTPWLQICGEDFIAKAFEYAHEADPKAILFYNDYNTESPGKRERIYKMVKALLAKKVPIHGVGLQGHWSLDAPGEQELKKSIQQFASLGLQVQVTELDVTVYTQEHSQRPRRPEDTASFTPAQEQRQIDQYKMFFRVFRENRKALTSVTFWNVSDRRTWLDNFPVQGRKNYPLLFNEQNKPKKAYWEVVKF